MEESTKQKITKAIIEKGVPLKDVASKLFMTEHHLRLLLEAWGVELPRKRRYNKMPIPERDGLMMLYKKYGKTAKLAEHFNVGINTVNKWMRELNIPTRKMKMPKGEKVKFLEEHLDKLNNISL